jgi:hypothetical protein
MRMRQSRKHLKEETGMRGRVGNSRAFQFLYSQYVRRVLDRDEMQGTI